jgi:aliphatic nitrilase
MTVHRVATVQAEPVWLDIDATTDKTERLMEAAAEGGAQLVGFPETWLPGYPVFLWSHPVYEQDAFVGRYYANSTAVDGEHIRRIRECALRLGITAVVGFSEKDGGSLYMSQVLIGPDGEVLLHRRKLKPTHAERALFGEGDGSSLRVVDSQVGRLGTLNCFEHLQPLSKFAMYAQNEQVHVAGWPCLGILGQVPALGSEAIIAATRTYAHEGSAFVLLASQIMSEAGAQTFATSTGGGCPIYTGGGGIARIFGPDTSLLTEPLDPQQEGIVFADIDLSAIDAAKNFLDPAGHYARPDVTQLLLDNRPRRAMIHIEGPQSTNLTSNGCEQLQEPFHARDLEPTT